MKIIQKSLIIGHVFLTGTNSKPKKVSFFRKLSRAKEPSPAKPVIMQQPSIEMALRELTHPAHNEQLKNQQQVTFKLVKTGKILNLIKSNGSRVVLN